jgi:hypothetical protein
MPSKVLDLEALERLRKAVDTLSSHFQDDDFRSTALGHLNAVAHEFSIEAATIPLLPPKPQPQLDGRSEHYVRKMQALIEEEPEDVVTQLAKYAAKLHLRITGRTLKAADEIPEAWVPEEYIEECEACVPNY